MAGIEEIRRERLKKLALLKESGRDPYPSKVPRDCSLGEVRARFAEYEREKKALAIVGRVMAIRGQGAIQFIVLNDGDGTFQVVLKRDVMGEASMELFAATADIGDFVGFFGELMKTQRGEESLLAQSWTMAAKSLLPLPEKWHGLQDEEEKLRLRYLDLLLDPELRELFVKKSKFWNTIRSFMIAEGFLEVETPVLENMTGGADARPFKTHHNALDMDVYLRISAGELWQKRLMVAGFNKVFEIGRIFRNEGVSADHLQDYTAMEFYQAYSSYTEGMQMVEEMYKYVIQKTFGTLKFKIRGFDVDFGAKWEKYDYVSTISKYTKVNIMEASLPEMEKALQKMKIDYDKNGFNKT